MNNKSDQSSMFEELAIIEYVAGDLSADAHMRFEQRMEQDTELKDKVQEEILMRRALESADQAEPVEMDNFERLLQRIDQPASVQKPVNQKGPAKVVGFSQRVLALAASLAVVGVISAGLFQNLVAPEYITLTNIEQSQKVDFVELARAGRLARLDLVERFDEPEMLSLLQGFDLQLFNFAANSKSVMVASAHAIGPQQLQQLMAHQKIKYAEIVIVKESP